jgi:hypothetical protein
MQTEGLQGLDAATRRSPRRNAAAIALILALVAVGARAANGTFSDSHSVAMGSTAAGNVTLTEGTNSMTVAMDLYPDTTATVKRVITLTSGSLVPKTITVNPTFTSSNLDASGMITYDVDRCSVAWTGGSPLYDYTCGGVKTDVLTGATLSNNGSQSLTTGSDLTASAVNRYMFEFKLSTSSPANAYGAGISTTVTFTFTATQRDGVPK